MTDWVQALHAAASSGQHCMLVSIVRAQGSTPRELGAKMVVTEQGSFATIGGGRFEYECVQLARRLLQQRVAHEIRRFSLGPSLGQCCGGAAEVSFDLVESESKWVSHLADQLRHGAVVLASVVQAAAKYRGHRWLVSEGGVFGEIDDAALDARIGAAGRHLLDTRAEAEIVHFADALGRDITVLVEPVLPHALNVVLFGAGHVGQALVSTLAGLACRITWVDSRRDVFPRDVPANVRCVVSGFPQEQVDAAPADSYYLVMTHSHPLDQMICEKILGRDDFRYCGLIGSKSKRRKFEKRFLAHGLPARLIEKLTCPIGIDGISGKRPEEISIAVAAQLLQVSQGHAQPARSLRPRLAAS